MLLLVAFLAAFVYAPGNPLTAFPDEIRLFLRNSLLVVTSINAVLAIQAYFMAKSKNLPALFWAAKVFVLGGIALFEVSEARDPAKLNDTSSSPTADSSRQQRRRSASKRSGASGDDSAPFNGRRNM